LLSLSGQYGQGDASSIYSTPQVHGVIEQPEAQNIQEVQRDQRGDQHHNSPDLSEGEKNEYGFWDPSRGPLNREASHPTDQPLPTADAEASTPKPFTREQLEDQEFAKYVKDIKELRQLAEDYRRQDDYRRQRYSSLRSRETQALPLAREAFKDNVAGTSIPRDTGAEASSSQDAGSVVDEKELEKGLNIALLIPEEHLNQLALRLTRDKAARGAANLIKLFRGLENRAQAISQMSKSLTGGREITQTMVSEAALLLRNALNKTSFKHSDIIKAKSVIDTLYETGKLPAASSSSEQASTSANPEPTQ
jgi:hypothetical protein